jgi:hypothetical protein
MVTPTFASQDQGASKIFLTHKKVRLKLVYWYIVNRWDPLTLDPAYDISNERESSGESICFCQNGSI